MFKIGQKAKFYVFLVVLIHKSYKIGPEYTWECYRINKKNKLIMIWNCFFPLSCNFQYFQGVKKSKITKNYGYLAVFTHESH